MENTPDFHTADLQDSQWQTPPEEVLLSDLVNSDEADPMSEAVLDSDASSGQRMLRLRVPQRSGSDVMGGDLDGDWYQAEVVGEEAVGGDNPTPDQNVTEDLLRSVGLSSIEVNQCERMTSWRGVISGGGSLTQNPLKTTRIAASPTKHTTHLSLDAATPPGIFPTALIAG